MPLVSIRLRIVTSRNRKKSLIPILNLNCRYDVKPMAKILGFVDSAQDTVDWPTSPALGIKTILEQLKLKVDDVASYEINEAFSVVILANAKLLGLNLDKVSSKIS